MSLTSLIQKMRVQGISRIEFSSAQGQFPRLYRNDGGVFNEALTHWFLTKYTGERAELMKAYEGLLTCQPLLGPGSGGGGVEIGINTQTGRVDELKTNFLMPLPLGLSSVMATMQALGVSVLKTDRDSKDPSGFNFLVSFTPSSNDVDRSHRMYFEIMNVLDQRCEIPLVIDLDNQTLRVAQATQPFSYRALPQYRGLIV